MLGSGYRCDYSSSRCDMLESPIDLVTFECQIVWGYLLEGAQPPDFLLEQIIDTDNPYAPVLGE